MTWSLFSLFLIKHAGRLLQGAQQGASGSLCPLSVGSPSGGEADHQPASELLETS